MAKFKKKKSEPTIDSDDSKKESIVDETSNIPETEKLEPISDDPSKNPIISVAEKSEKDRKLNKLFWLRVSLAIIGGIVATIIFEGIEGEERRWSSIALMISIFIGTIVIAKGMKMQLPSSDRKKIVTQAIGSYVFLYLFSWIVSFTLTHTGTTSSGINI